MDTNPPLLPGQPKPPDTHRRKRPPDDGMSDDSSALSESGTDSLEDQEFTVVMGRRLKRRMRTATQNGSSSASTIITSRVQSSTVVFATVSPTDNLTAISKRGVSMFLENLAPGQIKEVRFNPLRNVIAVDAINALTMEALLKVTNIGGVSVRPYVPRGPNTTVGVITGVDTDISEDDLMKDISASRKVIYVRRFGSSLSVKIVFAGDALPSHVKADLIRYPVRPFVPRATQCSKCWKVGHVIGVCNKPVTCSRCGGTHDDGSCTTQTVKCVNCHGAHDAKSTECPRLKKESAVLRRMARDNSTRREATAALRRRRSRRRRRAAPNTLRQPILPPTLVDPPPVTPLAPPVEQHHPRIGKANNETNLENRTIWPSLTPTSVQPAEQVVIPRTREPVGSMKDASDQQIRDMLKSLVSMLRVLIGRKQTPTALAAVQFIDSLLPILCAM